MSKIHESIEYDKSPEKRRKHEHDDHNVLILKTENKKKSKSKPKIEGNSGSPEQLAVHAPLVAPVVLPIVTIK